MGAQVTEQQVYEVLEEYPDFELRRYPDHLVAETEVGGPFELAGNPQSHCNRKWPLASGLQDGLRLL